MIATTVSATPPQTKFSQEDYDFSTVPDVELETCVQYEYMRESKAAILAVVRSRKELEADAKRAGQKGIEPSAYLAAIRQAVEAESGNFFRGLMIVNLAVEGSFPVKPWQRVKNKSFHLNSQSDAGSYEKLLGLMTNPALVIEPYSRDPSLDSATLSEWRAKTTPALHSKLAADLQIAPEAFLISGFFQINTLHSRRQLIESFEEWLDHNQLGHEEPVIERRGRPFERDALNALGALRLRYFCRTLEHAQELIKPLRQKENGMSYCDRTSFNRACVAAVKHFKNILRLSSEQLPLHFTEGWQK